MGLFSYLKKKPEFTENVCANEKAKEENMMSALRRSISGGRITILAYHFRHNRDTAVEWLDQYKIPYREQNNAYWLTGLSAISPVVNLIKSSDLRGYAANPVPEQSISGDVHLMEHYPIPDRDDEILALSDIASIKFQFIAWSSLDEPLMKVFGGERITGMMKQLGMNENEIISHPFVAKAIHNAQEKIAKKTNADSECKSSEEWFHLHLQTTIL